ncbi:cytochrome p450 family protein expressed [Citrus sinensis]|uniref:geraniol 8-hydroxylase-like isoform X2 n=1 Tax=Citrus sinensis TaxID=2711 RepID=UPI0021946FEB|nr:geraniol 8-hydroxylase-like isoform X2 [Citrus sinensis]KAH9657646.1 cytochrome p450 family protein expressed [Citrus sinensis]
MDLMISCILWLIFTLVLVIALSFISRGRRKHLPPGPRPYPVIGNLLELGGKPHKSLANLAKIYGPIMSLRLGQVTTVVVSSTTMAKAILKNHDSLFCDRKVPEATLFQSYRHHEFSLVWLPVSPLWKNLRKVCNMHIFTSQKLDANQDLRRRKIKDLLSYVEENCRAVLGILEEAGNPNLSDYFPLLKKLDLQGLRRRSAVFCGKMFQVFDRLVDQRLKQRQEHSCSISTESKDILDILLNIVQEKSVDIDIKHIKHLFADLFIAGNDTTSITMEWAMAELLHNPEALLKTKLELEQIVGKGNPIEESDISQLPYLQAVVKETFRLHPAVPLLIPRKALEDVEVAGFTVPKGAQVFVNVWAIGRDESTWDKPHSFMPERFLGLDVDFKGRNFELIPFGAGRRICPGLPLAIRMLHLMLGSLINSFDWKLENENMDMEEKFGLTVQKAQPLHVVPVAI